MAFGFIATGIPNAAHIGGMLMGGILALAWYALQRLRQGLLAQIVVLILGAILTYAVYQYCQSLVHPLTPLWQQAIGQMRSQLNF